MRFLVDTNILIYYFNGLMTDSVKSLTEDILTESFVISIITRLEFMGWRKHSEQSYKTAGEFLHHAHVLQLGEDVCRKTVLLRRSHSIKLPDAIICATAMVYDLILVTRNVKDFDTIPVEMVNPFDP